MPARKSIVLPEFSGLLHSRTRHNCKHTHAKLCLMLRQSAAGKHGAIELLAAILLANDRQPKLWPLTEPEPELQPPSSPPVDSSAFAVTEPLRFTREDDTQRQGPQGLHSDVSVVGVRGAGGDAVALREQPQRAQAHSDRLSERRVSQGGGPAEQPKASAMIAADRQAVLRLLGQLCFRHKANCGRLVQVRGAVEEVLRVRAHLAITACGHVLLLDLLRPNLYLQPLRATLLNHSFSLSNLLRCVPLSVRLVVRVFSACGG